MKSMTVGQALAIVSQICANVQGTLKEHQVIQEALQVIEQGLKRDEQPVVEPPAPAPPAAATSE